MKIARVLSIFLSLVLATSISLSAGPAFAKGGRNGEDHENDRNENRGPCRLNAPDG